MQDTLVVSGRRLQGRWAMGQLFHQYQIPKATPMKDVERTYSAEELMKAFSEIKTAEEALNLYKAILLNYSIRAKVAFLTDLWKKIKASPELTKALEATEDGRAWLDIFRKSEGAFLSYTQPNLFTNAARMKAVLETVLLKNFGIAVKVRTPVYRPGATELDYADTIVPSVGVKQVYDFGDLSKTTFGEDTKSLEEAMRAINPNFRMGLPPLLIAFITLASSIVTGYGIYKFTTPPSIPPEMSELLKKLPPKDAAELIKHWYESTKPFGGIAETLQWVAIAAGAVILGAVAIHFVLK